MALFARQRELTEDRLLEGEEVLVRAEIARPEIYWKSFVVFIIAMLFWVFVAPQLGVILLVTSLLMFMRSYLQKSILLLALTNKRVLVRYGLLQIDVVDVHFDKIESIELERMLPGYLLGYATVVLMGTGNRYIRIPYVANGEALRKVYNELTLSEKRL